MVLITYNNQILLLFFLFFFIFFFTPSFPPTFETRAVNFLYFAIGHVCLYTNCLRLPYCVFTPAQTVPLRSVLKDAVNLCYFVKELFKMSSACLKIKTTLGIFSRYHFVTLIYCSLLFFYAIFVYFETDYACLSFNNFKVLTKRIASI